MGIDLLILRHGNAEPKGAGHDLDRELKDKGKRKAQRIGVWLASHGLMPEQVVTSPALRARTTAEKCFKTGGGSVANIDDDERLYLGSIPALLELIAEVPQHISKLLLVGHNPSLSLLAAHLTNRQVQFKAGTLAHVKSDKAWKDASTRWGELIDIIDPATLPKLFPYPSATDKPSRIRPSYYYQQSSVIPFRQTPDGLKVLVISSSKRKHWVVPKGIIDPGSTAQASAAKEALEEAGIKGTVLDILVGTYSYPKWEAICTVAVYPMMVNEVQSEEDWAESHRDRRWVTVADAAQLVRNEDLKYIVSALPEALGDMGL